MEILDNTTVTGSLHRGSKVVNGGVYLLKVKEVVVTGNFSLIL